MAEKRASTGQRIAVGIIALVVTVLIVAAIKNSPPAHTVIGGMAFMAFGAFIYLVNSQTGD